MNGIEVINFKEYASGALLGYCDISLGGVVVRGCKIFRKAGENGDRLWFGFPSLKKAGRDGAEVWEDVVESTGSYMKHLQALARPQIEALIDGKAKGPPLERSHQESPPTRPPGAPASDRRPPAGRGTAAQGDLGFKNSRAASQAADGADIPW